MHHRYLVIALAILLLVVAAIIWHREEIAAPSSYEPEKTTEKTSAVSFQTTAPDEWKFTEQAEKDIQVLGEGQKITGVLQDPTDPRYYFVTTNTSLDCDAVSHLFSVYRYNSEDLHFDRLFRQMFSSQPYEIIFLRGYDRDRLVFSKALSEDKTSLCAQPWDISELDLTSMSLENPYTGFTPYTLTKDGLKILQKQPQTCLQACSIDEQ